MRGQGQKLSPPGPPKALRGPGGGGPDTEKKKKIKLSDIKNRDFISVWKGSGSRVYFENALALQNEDLDWTYEVRHIPSALAMVEQGLGITLAPKLAVSSNHHTAHTQGLKHYANQRRSHPRTSPSVRRRCC